MPGPGGCPRLFTRLLSVKSGCSSSSPKPVNQRPISCQVVRMCMTNHAKSYLTSTSHYRGWMRSHRDEAIGGRIRTVCKDYSPTQCYTKVRSLLTLVVNVFQSTKHLLTSMVQYITICVDTDTVSNYRFCSTKYLVLLVYCNLFVFTSFVNPCLF